MKLGDEYTMVRSSIRALGTLSAVLLLSNAVITTSLGQQKPAYDLLPESTQAVVWIPSGEKLIENWEKTQLAKLAEDSTVAPFFEEQRQEIEKRFVDAGWRLNIKPDDVRGFLIGQVAVAWMEQPEVPRKPFAMAMLADVANERAANAKLLDQVDKELKNRNATRTNLKFGEVAIAKYILPARAGELLAQQTYYAITDGYFVSTDDESLIREILTRIASDERTPKTLAEDEVFIQGRELLKISGKAQAEYFVRPLGFARVVRSIGGKNSRSNADMLAILQNQGFEAIKCVCGEVSIGGEKLDLYHRGYVVADNPLPMAAAILDFPNKASREIPNFIGGKISSLLVTNWNAGDAFWKAEGLVDEIAGTEGVFKEVIQGIKQDPNGPQIDLEKEVLPLFTNDIYSINDTAPGDIDVNSRRNLIALKVKDTAAMADVVDRAMSNEPDAKLVEFDGHVIWQVMARDEDELDNLDLGGEFGDSFGDDPELDDAADDEQKWLNEWAITVYDGYLMFASHVELIEDAITQAKTNAQSPLFDEPDFIQATNAIADIFGKEDASAWNVIRTDRASRVQYELFRAGKLKQSQSMLASILDKLLDSDSEIEVKEQRVNGAALPAFKTIAKFLKPSAMLTRTTAHGWEFGSILLAADDVNKQPELELSTRTEIGTARVISTTKSNR